MSMGGNINQAIKLAVNVSGTNTVTDLTNALTNNKATLDVLGTQFKNGAILIEDYIKKVAALVKQQKELGQALDEVERIQAGNAQRQRIDNLVKEERALEQLTAQLETNRVAREKEIAAEAWMTRQTHELDAALQGMLEHEKMAATATIDVTASMNSSTKAMGANATQTRMVAQGYDGVQKSTRMAGYGMLAFSYAAQDFAQSGLPAVMNNIPMMVMGLGGSSGLAGSLMIAAAGFQLLQPHMEKFGKQLGLMRDPLRDANGDLVGLKEQLAAISDKPFKVATDYAALKELREEIRKTEAAVSAWESLKQGRSSAQQEAKAAIDEGIMEGGGARNIEEAILASKKKSGTLYAGSTKQGDLAVAQSGKKNAAFLAKNARKSFGGLAGDAADLVTEHYAGEVNRIMEEMDKEARDKIATTVANASRSPAALKELTDYYMGNQQEFAKRGITAKFGGALVAASPDNIAAAKENRKSVKEQTDKAALDKARVGKDVGEVYGGVDDQLEKAMVDALKGGKSVDQIKASQHGGLMATLGQRGVNPDIMDRVADQILTKAAENAQNVAKEGRLPKLDVQAAQAKANVDTVRKQAVDKVDQAFMNRAIRALTYNELLQSQGSPDAVSDAVANRRVQSAIAHDLPRGQKDLAPDILAKSIEQMQIKMTEAVARTPMPDPTMMAAAVGSQQANAMASLAQMQAAMIDVLAGVGQQIGAVQQRTIQNQGKLNNAGRNMDRAPTQGKTGLTNLNGSG